MDVESDDRLLMALPRAIEAAEADEKARGLKRDRLCILPIELISAMWDRRAIVAGCRDLTVTDGSVDAMGQGCDSA